MARAQAHLATVDPAAVKAGQHLQFSFLCRVCLPGTGNHKAVSGEESVGAKDWLMKINEEEGIIEEGKRLKIG